MAARVSDVERPDREDLLANCGIEYTVGDLA
jgi:hypothetical protein